MNKRMMRTSVALAAFVSGVGGASACSVCDALALGSDVGFADATGADTITRFGRWSQTATDGNTGPRGTPITLTWSIVPDGTRNGTQISDLVSYLDGKWGVVGGDPHDVASRPWLVPIQQGMERWGQIAGIDYVFQNNDDGANFNATNVGVPGQRGDVRIRGFVFGSAFAPSILAFNQFPNDGDMTLDTGEATAYSPSAASGNFMRNIIGHEHGHGLGLGHLIGATNLMSPGINPSIQGPQFHDILVAQRNYGDVLEKNGGNDTLASATPMGTLAIGGSFGVGLDTPDFGGSVSGITFAQTDFLSIDGSNDADVFSFEVDGRSQANFTLNPRGPQYNASQEGGTPMAFNASQRSDLLLDIFDAQGVRLSRLNTGGLGVNETISGFKLPEAGTYFARVAGTEDQIQMYSLEVSRAATAAVADPNVIFTDSFTVDGGSQANVNSFRQTMVRQGGSVVDARYDVGSTDAEDTQVTIAGNRLVLSSVSDADGGNQAFVDLNRNFLPQLEGQAWSLTFDATLTADVGLGDAWLGLTFNDNWPIGLPFGQDAELGIFLRQTGGYVARENGGDAPGELFVQSSVPVSDSYAFEFSVDETGPGALMSLRINGQSIFADEAVTLNDVGRYFALRAHVGGTNAVGLGLEVAIDNLLISLQETMAALAGDYNGSGSVEQGDLDLVLNNWGGPRGVWSNADGFASAGVDQEELDRVLNNWGSSVAPALAGLSVPEPGAVAWCVGLGLLARRGGTRKPSACGLSSC